VKGDGAARVGRESRPAAGPLEECGAHEVVAQEDAVAEPSQKHLAQTRHGPMPEQPEVQSGDRRDVRPVGGIDLTNHDTLRIFLNRSPCIASFTRATFCGILNAGSLSAQKSRIRFLNSESVSAVERLILAVT